MNTLADFGCRDSSSLKFIQISLILGVVNLFVSFALSIYRFCTWRSTMLADVELYVRPIVEERK